MVYQSPYSYERFGVSTPSTDSASTTADLKTWLRVDTSDEDTEIAFMGMACQNILEDLTNTTMMQQTMKVYFDGFPPEGTPMRLPRPPLISVTSIKYVDADGTQQTWSNTLYEVSTLGKLPAEILPIESESYPTTGSTPTASVFNKVEVEYTAGYATRGEIPEGFVVGHRMFVGHFYNNREAATTANVKDLPLGLQMIVAANKVPEVN